MTQDNKLTDEQHDEIMGAAHAYAKKEYRDPRDVKERNAAVYGFFEARKQFVSELSEKDKQIAELQAERTPLRVQCTACKGEGFFEYFQPDDFKAEECAVCKGEGVVDSAQEYLKEIAQLQAELKEVRECYQASVLNHQGKESELKTENERLKADNKTIVTEFFNDMRNWFNSKERPIDPCAWVETWLSTKFGPPPEHYEGDEGLIAQLKASGANPPHLFTEEQVREMLEECWEISAKQQIYELWPYNKDIKDSRDKQTTINNLLIPKP